LTHRANYDIEIEHSNEERPAMYNFTDHPKPILNSIVDPSGSVGLEQGSPQGNFITTSFGGDSVSVSIEPPDGWSLDDVVWTTGGTGTFDVPAVGQEEQHEFTYTVSKSGSTQTSGGAFKIKNGGTAPPP
jgi:hypothetical protein